MIPRIKELLHASPFEAFKLRTSDGREYVIPTAGHAAVAPKGAYIIVFGDDGSSAKIAGLHVAAIVEPTAQE